jgi:lysophospholipase L1-like esterase
MRQAVVAVLCLAALDRLMPGWLASAEARRYELETALRFEQSDIFALGPLVSYLREQPHGPRPRIAFLGDSIVWGYGVPAEDTVAARFQARAPAEHVLNLGMNGTDTGDMYLIAKSVLDSVATLYVFDRRPRVLHQQLPQVIPVARDDLTRFGLTPPVHASGNDVLSFWRLFRDSYRIQAAGLGTSTRVFTYSRLATAGKALRRRPDRPAADVAVDATAIGVDSPVAAVPPSAERAALLSRHQALLWDFAQMVRDRHRTAVFVEMATNKVALADDERADLNAQFGPEVRFVLVDVPPALMIDGSHLNRAGAVALAEILSRVRPPGAPQ